MKQTAAKLVVMKGEAERARTASCQQRPSVAHELHCNLAVCASTCPLLCLAETPRRVRLQICNWRRGIFNARSLVVWEMEAKLPVASL